MERIQEPTSHESFAQSHVKMGDQNKRNQDLSIPKSLNAETGSQGVMNWQGEATVYETVPYDANGIAPKPNDLFLFPMMASGSLSGWTFGQTRLNSSNFNNPIAGFAASPTAGAPIPIAFPQMGPTGMDGVMSFDKDTSDPDMDMKMAAIDTDTNMPAIKYGQVQSSHGRNGFRENQGDSPNIDGTKGAFRAI